MGSVADETVASLRRPAVHVSRHHEHRSAQLGAEPCGYERTTGHGCLDHDDGAGEALFRRLVSSPSEFVFPPKKAAPVQDGHGH